MARYQKMWAACFLAFSFAAGGAATAEADDFYDASAAVLDGPPGSLIRFRGMDVPLTEASAYRVLYRSTGLDGEVIAVSGMVIIPDGKPPAGGWPVVAWAHPTTGIAQECAPSVILPNPVTSIPGINEILSRGYVVAATDYPGLGTAGPHPYLVGVSEGRAVLDSVRAARAMGGVGDRIVVWGHSQGGQAALFAGQIAGSYAPGLELLGVAVAAPATELDKLFEDDVARLAGRVLGAFVIDSWSQKEVYDAPAELLVPRSELPLVEAVGERCISLMAGELAVVLAGRKLSVDFLKADPAKVEPWRSLIAKNTPGKAPIRAPLFVAQSTADKIVDPSVTVGFVQKLCEKGETVDFKEYKRVSHDKTAKASAADTLAWIAGRFAGAPAPDTCR